MTPDGAADYQRRINRAIDLAVEHIADDLPLVRLATAAGFRARRSSSPPSIFPSHP